MDLKKTFVSYSSVDSSNVDEIVLALESADIDVWRDKDDLYVGDKWPKTLGEAIAFNDTFVLVWSVHSSKSEFVDLAWSTAIALKKKIIPILIDATPLPPSLSAIHGIIFHDPEYKSKLLSTFSGVTNEVDRLREREVTDALEKIAPGHAAKVSREIKGVYAENKWVPINTAFHAGRDIYITNIRSLGEGILSKWQTWVTLIVGILAIVTWFLDLPGKIPKPDDPVICEVIAEVAQAPEGKTLEDVAFIEFSNSTTAHRFHVDSSGTAVLKIESVPRVTWDPAIVWSDASREVFPSTISCPEDYRRRSSDGSTVISLRTAR